MFKAKLLAVGFLSIVSTATFANHAEEQQAQPAQGEAKRAEQTEDNLAFVTRSNKKLYSTGTPDQRREEAKLALEKFLKSQGKDGKNLSAEQTLQMTLDMLKSDGKNLSVNALQSIFNDVLMIRLFSSIDVAKLEADLKKQDADKKGDEKFGNALGKAFGNALMIGMAKAFQEEKNKALPGLSKQIIAEICDILDLHDKYRVLATGEFKDGKPPAELEGK